MPRQSRIRLSRQPKTVVREGWNHVSRIYRPDGVAHDVFGHSFDDHLEWLRPILESVPRGSRVLDLGCGCGVPDCLLLSDRFRVTGVDISDVQIERARRFVPKATFRRADMTELGFPPARFGAIVCVYSLIHVPLAEQRGLLRRVHRWLEPGGWFLIVTGHDAYEGIQSDWLGSRYPMYWSHADAETYQRWFQELRFEVVRRECIPEGSSGHELFLLRVPQRAPSRERGDRTVETRRVARSFPGPQG